MPDQLIEYLPSLLTQAIQFYSCFISYSTKDQDFAERLYADLQNKGVRCWFAPHDIQRGKKIHQQIDEAIRLHDRLLLILSEASIHSEWVKTEISKARKREIREKRRMLFPVTLVDFETLRNWECFRVPQVIYSVSRHVVNINSVIMCHDVRSIAREAFDPPGTT